VREGKEEEEGENVCREGHQARQRQGEVNIVMVEGIESRHGEAEKRPKGIKQNKGTSIKEGGRVLLNGMPVYKGEIYM